MIQGIKRGIMEMADGIVINKADGDNLERASWLLLSFVTRCIFSLRPNPGWTPQVLTYSGFYNIGVKEVWDMVYEYIGFVKSNGYFEYHRNEQSKYWMYEVSTNSYATVSTIIRRLKPCFKRRNNKY